MYLSVLKRFSKMFNFLETPQHDCRTGPGMYTWPPRTHTTSTTPRPLTNMSTLHTDCSQTAEGAFDSPLPLRLPAPHMSRVIPRPRAHDVSSSSLKHATRQPSHTSSSKDRASVASCYLRALCHTSRGMRWRNAVAGQTILYASVHAHALPHLLLFTPHVRRTLT